MAQLTGRITSYPGPSGWEKVATLVVCEAGGMTLGEGCHGMPTSV